MVRLTNKFLIKFRITKNFNYLKGGFNSNGSKLDEYGSLVCSILWDYILYYYQTE